MKGDSMNTGLLDKNGNEIMIGDTVTAEIRAKTGERMRRRGRTKLYYSVEEKRTITGVVKFGIFKDMITLYLETGDVEKYVTHFYSGCGRTRAEKRANECVEVEHSLSRVITVAFAATCEIVK